MAPRSVSRRAQPASRRQSGATLTHVDVGIGPLILLFGLIALMGWIGSALAARWRVNGFLSSAAGMLNSTPAQGLTQRVTQWILSGSVRWAASRFTTVDNFLRGMADHQARRWGIAALVLLPPAVLLTALETNSFWVVGPSGIVEHRMFPPFSSRRYDFSEARALTTGCNHTDQSNRLIYEIYLSSGEHFDLGDTEPFTGNKIGAVEGDRRQRRPENRTQAVVTFGARSGPSNLPHRLGSTVRPGWPGSPCQAVAPYG